MPLIAVVIKPVYPASTSGFGATGLYIIRSSIYLYIRGNPSAFIGDFKSELYVTFDGIIREPSIIINKDEKKPKNNE